MSLALPRTAYRVGELFSGGMRCHQIRPAAGGDGEAQKYFDHAMTLYKTLTFLRAAADSDPSTAVLSNASGVGTAGAPSAATGTRTLSARGGDFRRRATPDLLRFESLSSLDAAACQRVLARSYDVVISMAPVLANCRTLQAPLPCHFGPAIPEVPARRQETSDRSAGLTPRCCAQIASFAAGRRSTRCGSSCFCTL